MTYDHWKTTNPADEFLGSHPDEREEEPELYQCDCCERMVPPDELSRVWVFGIETFACEECRNDNI